MDNKTENLIAAIKQEIPGFSIKAKETSTLMKFLYYISFMFLWNPAFMSSYITTIGQTIYAPGGFVNWNELAHEFVHMSDNKKSGKFIMFLKYFFPQNLSIFAPFAILAVFNIWFLLFLTFLLFLAPWPAPFREQIETRGYAATMMCYRMTYPGSTWPIASSVVDIMSGWGYYKMSWSKSQLFAKVLLFESKILKGDLKKESPFDIIVNSFE